MQRDDRLPELFRLHPALQQSIPHVRLGTAPTPVELLEIDGAPILVKRDDVISADYGGNKVRKLEFILAEARAQGATRLITAGAAGSHHAFATAYHGRRLGFASSLVLFPQSLTPHVREMILLDAATGAELWWATGIDLVPFGLWRARRANRTDRCHVIPPGGSSITGTLGYVEAALELAAQIERGELSRPSSIHVAAGTLGTTAGLAVGLALAGLEIPIEAVRITSRVVTNERVLTDLVRGVIARLRAAGLTAPVDPGHALRLVRLRHDQIGAGYGRETAAGARASDAFAAAGLTLDVTYTAKAAAALLADRDRDAHGNGALPLFWHTLSASHPAELVMPSDTDITALPIRRYLSEAGG